jgi:hypothetical protein
MLGLVHSPVVGPLVWYPLAEELHRRGEETVIPELADHPSEAAPYWQHHARSVARGLRQVPASAELILVGHSGAGPLLPAIREAADRPVAGYVFVDAGLPRDGASRLELLNEEIPEAARELERILAGGERHPRWTDADLEEAIPTPGLRRGVVESVRPRPEAFYTEPIPVFDGWPDAPCGYLLLSESYRVPFERAASEDWATRELEGGHFHMLADPPAVADALLEIVAAIR